MSRTVGGRSPQSAPSAQDAPVDVPGPDGATRSAGGALAEVVVVTYHSFARAERELLAFAALAGRDARVRWTFLDNSEDSRDAARLEHVLAQNAYARVIRRPDNIGFAGGCNEVGLVSSAEWLVCINPDVMLDAEHHDGIVDALAAADRDVSSIALAQRTGALTHQGVAFNRLGWFMDRPIASNSEAKARGRARIYQILGGGGEVVGPSGGAGCFRSSSFRAAGGFFEPYFAWGEDADLALRLSLSGSRCERLDAVLPHQGGHSVSSPRVTRRRAHLLARNRVVLAARLYTLPQVLVFTAFFAAVLVAKTLSMLRSGTLSSNWRGAVEGYRHFASWRSTYTGPRLRAFGHNLP